VAEQILGPHHPDVATGLHNLAEIYQVQGHYTKAELLALRALTMRERLFGPDHADVAASLHALALLYVAQAQYGKAEPLYIRALATDEQTLGSDHADIAILLENYAALLRQTQCDTYALTIQTRAKAIYTRYARQSSPR
jgi:tetratricopeptide (TPR) repeat protein